jgi:DGQHR domain-containing protein
MAGKPLTAEQKQKREERAFSRRVQTLFKNAGFTHLPTAGINRKFGAKMGELDNVFVYQNIILVCEDTLSASNKVRDHLKNKKMLFDQIDSNRDDFLGWLREAFADRFEVDGPYASSRYKIFYLYFSKSLVPFQDGDDVLFTPVRVVEQSTINYFYKMTQNIKKSAKSDIFRFLGLRADEIGVAVASSGKKDIPATVIYPDDSTGLKNGIKVVSFMMSAESLLNNAYVLRKDNWEDSIQLYQRLIEKPRIHSIRKYLALKKTTFINNIIVSLPDGVTFQDEAGATVDASSVDNFHAHKMLIPDELNSICVIDGQHRIYAHYEGFDTLEPEIAKLRKKFHLLVTGIIFPPSMAALDRRKYESEIFLDINSQAKQVPPDVLLFIETLKDPFSDLGLSREVLARLNRNGAFTGLFQLSLMEDAPIKTASIIKFALRYLVAIVDDVAKPSLFQYWADGPKRAELLEKKSEALREEYVEWVAQVVGVYFGAVKSRYKSQWKVEDSRLLSTTAINGFVIALRRSLPACGVLDYEGYKAVFADFNQDFSSEGFKYASSQYGKFSRSILTGPMKLVETDGNWIKQS